MKKIYILAIATLFGTTISAQNNGLNGSPAKDVVAATSNGHTSSVENLRNGEKLNIYSFNNNVFVASEGFGAINGSIEVYDIIGKQITRTNFYSNNFQMPVDVQASGIYIVRVNINGRSFSQRLYIR